MLLFGSVLSVRSISAARCDCPDPHWACAQSGGLSMLSMLLRVDVASVGGPLRIVVRRVPYVVRATTAYRTMQDATKVQRANQSRIGIAKINRRRHESPAPQRVEPHHVRRVLPPFRALSNVSVCDTH
eukprot:1449141-Prymnesium_polylepis.1